jgi:hypothetical protein
MEMNNHEHRAQEDGHARLKRSTDEWKTQLNVSKKVDHDERTYGVSSSSAHADSLLTSENEWRAVGGHLECTARAQARAQ